MLITEQYPEGTKGETLPLSGSCRLDVIERKNTSNLNREVREQENRFYAALQHQAKNPRT